LADYQSVTRFHGLLLLLLLLLFLLTITYLSFGSQVSHEEEQPGGYTPKPHHVEEEPQVRDIDDVGYQVVVDPIRLIHVHGAARQAIDDVESQATT